MFGDYKTLSSSFYDDVFEDGCVVMCQRIYPYNGLYIKQSLISVFHGSGGVSSAHASLYNRSFSPRTVKTSLPVTVSAGLHI